MNGHIFGLGSNCMIKLWIVFLIFVLIMSDTAAKIKPQIFFNNIQCALSHLV